MKNDRGLSFKNMHLVNNAFRFKLYWVAFTKANSFRVQMLCAKYNFKLGSGFIPIVYIAYAFRVCSGVIGVG